MKGGRVAVSHKEGGMWEPHVAPQKFFFSKSSSKKCMVLCEYVDAVVFPLNHSQFLADRTQYNRLLAS